MKRIVKLTLIVFPILIVAGALFLVVVYRSAPSALKTAVESVGGKATKASVSIENVDFSVFSGKGEINGLKIGNPEGFNTDSAFKLGKTRVVVDRGTVFSDRIVIKEILIEAPEITYEAGLGVTNIGALRKNIEEFAAKFAGDGGEEPAPEEEAGPGKTVQIDLFVIKDAKVRLSATVLGGKALTIPLPEIRLTDIGKEKEGRSIPEIVSEVFAAIADAIVDAVKGAGGIVGKGAGELKDTAKEAGEAAKDAAGKAVGGIKGLFKRD